MAKTAIVTVEMAIVTGKIWSKGMVDNSKKAIVIVNIHWTKMRR